MALPKIRQRRFVYGGLIALGVVAALLAVLGANVIEQRLRPAAIALLERQLDSRVELARLDAELWPVLRIRGEGLTVRYQGRTDIPPLISIRMFTMTGGVADLWRRRIERVELDGLELTIPPRRGADMPGGPGASSEGQRDVLIGEIVTQNSLLTVMPKRVDKAPRVFQIRELRLTEFGFDRASAFRAALTNPVPVGEIESQGTFGPWAADEPSATPVAGQFTFDADLATIRGIGGSLHAEGQFEGPLDSVRSSGRTLTKDFHLSTGAARFPLAVDYDAVVDGTSGDTTLTRVDAKLGPSSITARGAIVRQSGGRHISLDTTTRGGRLEDFVRLATRVTTSPLEGRVDLDAKLVVPPGPDEVIERMQLEGRFDVTGAQFTAESVQAKVDDLARRSVGRPEDTSIDDVTSRLQGKFALRDGQLRLSTLQFSAAGAAVRLGGRYDILRETLDFRGELRLRARASQTQTGWKRFVLKAFDPLLDGRGAGTVLPISITGTRNEPKFAADLKKALLR